MSTFQDDNLLFSIEVTESNSFEKIKQDYPHFMLMFFFDHLGNFRVVYDGMSYSIRTGFKLIGWNKDFGYVP